MPVSELAKVGLDVGSDVPFCVYGGACVVEGRGEQVGRLTGLSPCWIVLCKPDFSLATKEMYQRIDGVELTSRPDAVTVMLGLEWEDVEAVAKRVLNVFEEALTDEERKPSPASRIRCWAVAPPVRQCPAAAPLVYGIFTDEIEAKKAVDTLQGTYSNVFLTEPV